MSLSGAITESRLRTKTFLRQIPPDWIKRLISLLATVVVENIFAVDLCEISCQRLIKASQKVLADFDCVSKIDSDEGNKISNGFTLRRSTSRKKARDFAFYSRFIFFQQRCCFWTLVQFNVSSIASLGSTESINFLKSYFETGLHISDMFELRSVVRCRYREPLLASQQ